MRTENPGRVMLLIEKMGDGGAQVLVASLALALRDRGWHPLVYCWREGGALTDDLIRQGVDVRCLGLRRSSLYHPIRFFTDVFRIVTRMVRDVRREQVALIHSHLQDSNYLAALIGTLTKRPAVTTFHNVEMTPSERRPGTVRHWLRIAAIRAAVRRSRAAVAVGNDVGESLARLVGGKYPGIEVIRNGVAVPTPSPGARQRVREELGVSESAPTILCVARLVPQKAHCHLIRAMVPVVEAYPTATLLLVGQGPLEQSLRKLAAECGVAQNVVWLGQRNDVPEILAASDLFVLASEDEGIPLALLEAMSVGLPAVVTDIPGNSEVVEHEVNGLCVPYGSPERLGDAMIRTFRDPDGARRMASAAQALVQDAYSLDVMVTNTESLYRRVMNA